MASRTPSRELTADDLRELGLTQDSDEQELPPAGAVPRISWEEHATWLDENWKAGGHASIFAPNEGGKTHLIRYGLAPFWLRYPMLIIQYKRRDTALQGFGQPVKSFPSVDMRIKYQVRGVQSPKWDTDPEWFRLILPPYRWTAGKRKNAAYERAQAIAGEAIDKVYAEAGWVLVIDEVRRISDPRPPGLGLEAPLENIWQAARSEPVTLIGATQQPASAPSSMYDQPSLVYLGRTLDTGRHERLAEIGGNTKLIKSVLPTLRNHEFLFVHRQTGEMAIVTAPAR